MVMARPSQWLSVCFQWLRGSMVSATTRKGGMGIRGSWQAEHFRIVGRRAMKSQAEHSGPAGRGLVLFGYSRRSATCGRKFVGCSMLKKDSVSRHLAGVVLLQRPSVTRSCQPHSLDRGRCELARRIRSFPVRWEGCCVDTLRRRRHMICSD